jgi:hypothetical protein
MSGSVAKVGAMRVTAGWMSSAGVLDLGSYFCLFLLSERRRTEAEGRKDGGGVAW